ncbi:MAG: hypothetical protein ABI216_03575 [Devosia sp.]
MFARPARFEQQTDGQPSHVLVWQRDGGQCRPVAIGLGVASAIRSHLGGRFGATARTVLFIPQVIPLVAAGIA